MELHRRDPGCESIQPPICVTCAISRYLRLYLCGTTTDPRLTKPAGRAYEDTEEVGSPRAPRRNSLSAHILGCRFSEFDELRQKLVKTFPYAAGSLPPLPPKSVICKCHPCKVRFYSPHLPNRGAALILTWQNSSFSTEVPGAPQGRPILLSAVSLPKTVSTAALAISF